MQTLRNELKDLSKLNISNENKKSDVISSLFEGQLKTTLKCLESDEESIQSEITSFDKLKCHITIKIDHVSQGISNSLIEQIEKRGSTTDQNMK